MFETSLDAWYAWLGVATASVVVFGIALGLPTAAPPPAGPVAETIDEVAASQYEAHATVEIQAEEYRIDSHRIALHTDGKTAHATLAYGPVTPVDSDALGSVLDRGRPEAVYDSRAEFERAVERRQTGNGEWEAAPDRLAVRRVTWGDVDATLVG